jgi:cytoplasmic iron level regulating protein YaaA (DUF328/UPF0246 family)
MLLLISPAKTLDFDSPAPTELQTKPRFLNQAQALVDILRGFDVTDIQSLMSVSEKIAILNYDRFSQWKKATSASSGKQAIYAFQGDVYTGLNADSMNVQQQKRAQKFLRILSGLYGVLRPMDIMMPYRLEMGTKLANPHGKTLYAYWQTQITEIIEADIQASGSTSVLNLASNEYFKSVQGKSLSVDVIAPEFKDFKHGQYKIISFFAKKARGLMAQYCIQNKVTTLEQVLGFNLAGYYYDKVRSTPLKPVFLRDKPI